LAIATNLQMRSSNELSDLSDIALLRDDEIDLATAALRLAMLEYPRLDIASNLGEIDRLGERAAVLSESSESESRLLGLDKALFAEADFRGNERHYYDPRNSYLNEVLGRRLGIPITLSVLYIAVAERIGLDVEGIAFPGHFFVAHRSDGGVEYVDPFHCGARLDEADLSKFAYQANHDGTVSADMLRPAPRRLILVRMLRNLHAIYARANDAWRVIGCLDRILQIVPEEIEALGERGIALARLGEFSRARADLERYLSSVPEGPGATAASEALAALRLTIAMRN